jgi:general secretion pathway protein D
LNIANAIDTRTEIVSRPSLMTFLRKQSVFFSGNELVIGLSGQFGGTLTKYPVGITLLVTPESLEGDVLTLNIAIEGSLLLEANPNLQTTVNVGKTRVDTFAKVRLGETLMLGGIYERLEVSSNSGFPGLSKVPIVQYFFSNESTSSTRRSIVFMLTPRSPDAVKVAVNRAMARDPLTVQHLSELKNRNPDWFDTQPNLISVFRYLQKDPVIYYEFRSGDILPPSWSRELSTRNKLAQIESFLYY